MNKYLVLLTMCLAASSTAAHKLPDYIKKCSLKDPEFNACALKSARAAIPHLVKGAKKHNIPLLDPLIVKEVRAVESYLTMAAIDIKMQGIKNAVLQNISFDFDKQKVTTEVLVPEAHFTGNYELDGRLLALPITGKGPLDATLYDLYFKYTTGYNLTKMDDGEVYLVPTDYNVQFQPKNLKAKVGNLFNGNKLLGDSMNAFINENWQAVLNEVGQPTYDALGLIVHTILSAAAKTVPYKDIFDDTE